MFKCFRRKPNKNKLTTTTTSTTEVLFNGKAILSPEEDPDIPELEFEDLPRTEDEKWARELGFGKDFHLDTNTQILINEKLDQIEKLKLEIRKEIIKGAQKRCRVNQVISETAIIEYN